MEQTSVLFLASNFVHYMICNYMQKEVVKQVPKLLFCHSNTLQYFS